MENQKKNQQRKMQNKMLKKHSKHPPIENNKKIGNKKTHEPDQSVFVSSEGDSIPSHCAQKEGKRTNKNIPNNKINPTLNQTASIPNIKQSKKPNPKPNKKEETTSKKKDVMDNKSELTSIQSEKEEEEPSEDTFEDMISGICQNEFLNRWFVADEFYASFHKLYEDQVSSDCPKNLDSCKRIMKISYHPKTKVEMFHKQQTQISDKITLHQLYFCSPVGQCSICKKKKK